MKKYFLLVACLIVSAFCFSSCNESSNAIPEEEAIEFLQQVYPNMTDPEMEANGYEIWKDKVFLTDRCSEYASIECDYDPVYCTQDGYAWVKPNPAFTKHALMENGYVIEWTRSEDDFPTCMVLLVKQDDKVLIDNFIQPDGSLLFDYSKDPVPVYE